MTSRERAQRTLQYLDYWGLRNEDAINYVAKQIEAAIREVVEQPEKPKLPIIEVNPCEII